MMVNLQSSVPVELALAVKQAAEEAGVTPSWWLRQAVEEKLNQDEGDK